ncbi:MAG: membrane protein insertase YidC [Candidatus Aminicenantes bacterium]|nr:membrane protein insertase YidC [Candidatus Aminicenantes bacterium]
MDTKKLILAIVLSVAVLLVYQYVFMPKPAPRSGPPPAGRAEAPPPAAAAVEEAPPPGEPDATEADIASILGQGEPVAAAVEEAPLAAVEQDVAAPDERAVRVDSPLFTAVFTNRGAGLTSFLLKKYKDDAGKPMDLVARSARDFAGFFPFYFLGGEEHFAVLNKALFSYRGERIVPVSGRTEVVFEYADASRNLKAVKKFVFNHRDYVVGLEFTVVKDGRPLVDLPVVFGPDLGNNDSRDRAMMMNLKIAAFANEKLESIEFAKMKTQPQAGQPFEKTAGEKGSGFFWSAYETTYFAVVFRSAPQNRSKLAYQMIRRPPQGKEPAKLYSYMIVTDPAAAFMGPKDERALAAVEGVFPELNKIIEYGWFGSIAKIMLKGINAIHGFIPNYGWALIVFTLFLKLILFPLTYSSSVSMAKMQSLQPKLKAIKKKYKNTKDMEQRKLMNMEMMALYKQEKVNPAGGCLPLLLQLPLLWGFFRLLSVSINVRHEPWILWITDLSKKDPFYVLPILMGVTQLIQQRMTPSGGDDTQRKLMYILPFVMVIMFASFPSGLNLYWCFSNVLQIGQQYLINEKIHKQKKQEERDLRSLKRKKGAREK